MDKNLVAGLATIAAGGLVALQPPINSVLGGRIGDLAAVSVNFLVGLVVVVLITIVFASGFGDLGDLAAVSVNFLVGLVVVVLITIVFASGFGDLGEGRGLPWYYWLGGGFVGVAYVTTVLFTVRELGASGVTAATITGQLGASILIDKAGLLGIPETPITASRVVGVGLLVAGTILVVR